MIMLEASMYVLSLARSGISSVLFATFAHRFCSKYSASPVCLFFLLVFSSSVPVFQMASIGNYSRHLTEEDISRIGAATR